METEQMMAPLLAEIRTNKLAAQERMKTIQEVITAKKDVQQERMEANMNAWQEGIRPAYKRRRHVWKGRSQPQWRWQILWCTLRPLMERHTRRQSGKLTTNPGTASGCKEPLTAEERDPG
jgi:hypothetical protein